MMSETKLEVDGEDSTQASVHKPESMVDIHNRDPEHINDHIQVTFAEIIAEPEKSTYSFDKIFEISALVFTQTKLWIYRIIAAILAIPLMILWGIYFALLSFATIWLCVPCHKAFKVKLHFVRQIFEAIISTFVEPFYLAVGKVFYNIRITRA